MIARAVSRYRQAEYRVWVNSLAAEPISTQCRPISTEPSNPYQRIALLALERKKPWPILLLCAQYLVRLAQRHTTRCTSGSRRSSLLVKLLQDRWELHEETTMAKTGLLLSHVSVACMAVSGRPLPDHLDGTICQIRWHNVSVFCNLTWYSCPIRFRKPPS
jgi:hypothetical protein